MDEDTELACWGQIENELHELLELRVNKHGNASNVWHTGIPIMVNHESPLPEFQEPPF